MLGFVEVSTPKSYHCLLHKPQPLVRWQCVCMRTVYTLYFLMQEVHVCAQTSLCLSMSETNGSDIIPGVLYTVYSEVDACGRGLCVRVWRWAPDGWMVEIYGWTVALQRECVRRERDVWLKCCCFHTVTRLSHSRFVLDGVCLGLLATACPSAHLWDAGSGKRNTSGNDYNSSEKQILHILQPHCSFWVWILLSRRGALFLCSPGSSLYLYLYSSTPVYSLIFFLSCRRCC